MRDVLVRILLPPLLATAVLGAIALVCVWTQQAILAPSLGAAAFSQMLHADEKSAQPYNLAVGQLIGGLAGFLGVYAAGQMGAHPFIGSHDLPLGRVLAVAIAVFVASTGQILAGAATPTGGATALVVAIGVEKATVVGAVRLLVGILAVMLIGEAARRLIVASRKAGDG